MTKKSTISEIFSFLNEVSAAAAAAAAAEIRGCFEVCIHPPDKITAFSREVKEDVFETFVPT